MKPFLRWAGSKRKLLPKLAPYYLNKEAKYIEPFMGSACLFFHLMPSTAVLGDLNGELVNCYRQIRNNPQSVEFYLNQFSARGDKDEYYRIRQQFSDGMSDRARRAAAFIYLNRFCFNGLYRTNMSGKFNVPYGGGKTGRLPVADEINRISKALKSVKFLNEDFESTIKNNVSKDDFVYLDPPFSLENKRIFSQYNGHTFGMSDLDRIRDCLRFINSKSANFVMSYASSSDTDKLFNEWNVRRVYTQRNIAGFSSDRRKAREIIVTNMDV